MADQGHRHDHLAGGKCDEPPAGGECPSSKARIEPPFRLSGADGTGRRKYACEAPVVVDGRSSGQSVQTFKLSSTSVEDADDVVCLSRKAADELVVASVCGLLALTHVSVDYDSRSMRQTPP